MLNKFNALEKNSTGLQIRVPRFDSGRGLQNLSLKINTLIYPFIRKQSINLIERGYKRGCSHCALSVTLCCAHVS